MIRVVEAISDPSGSDNEDRYGAVGNAAWVLDGATGLAGRALFTGGSDARHFVVAVDDALHRLATGAEAPLTHWVRGAIRRAACELDLMTVAEGAQPWELPTASMALVRERDGHLEYATLGDCKVIVEAGDDVLVATENTRLEQLDRRLVEEIKALHRRGVRGFQDVFAALMGQLRALRARVNTPGGYWVLGASEAAADHLDQGVVDVGGVRHALLVSDGFYRLVDTFRLLTARELLQTAVDAGLSSLHAELRALEAADPDCTAYPRLKPADDATALLLRLNE